MWPCSYVNKASDFKAKARGGKAKANLRAVLSPILFLLYINDIGSVCCGNTILQLFADDAKLYCNIRIGEESLSLQQSLDRLVNWAKRGSFRLISISVQYYHCQPNRSLPYAVNPQTAF
jgi:hypothetical protein